jgi:integrase
VAGIKAFKEDNVVQNFLSADQLAQLFAALDADPNQTAAAALKLLALTGVRREEALQAEWRHIDLERGQWWLAKTKAGKGRWVMLNEAAKALLAGQPSRGPSPWVFPGRDGEKPIVNVRKTLDRRLAAAKLPHVRVHDLRHAFASVAINQGATLYEVQHLLGHASSQVTQRYAHQADRGLRRASQSVANVIGAAMVEAGKEAEKEGSPA